MPEPTRSSKHKLLAPENVTVSQETASTQRTASEKRTQFVEKMQPGGREQPVKVRPFSPDEIIIRDGLKKVYPIRATFLNDRKIP